MIKGVLGIGVPLDEPTARRLDHAAHAIDEIDPELLSEALAQVVRPAEEGAKGLAPHQLLYLVGSLGDLSPVWAAFPASSVPRVVTLIQTADYAELTPARVMSSTVKEPTIMAAIEARLDNMPLDELSATIIARPAPHHVDHAFKALADSPSFRSAESRMQRLVLPLAPYIDAQNLDRLLVNLRDNYQVNRASGMPFLLEQLYDATTSLSSALTAWERISEFLATNAEDDDDPDDFYTAPGLRAKISTKIQAP